MAGSVDRQMNINIGCGEYKAQGWVNVDTYAPVNPDVLAEATNLPFDDDSADRIYMGHILEHMSYDDVAPAALREARRVLKPTGQLCVVGPDMDAAVRFGYGQDVKDAIIGAQRGGQGPLAHQWCATMDLTMRLVAGTFTHVSEKDLHTLNREGWPLTSLINWQCGIIAW